MNKTKNQMYSVTAERIVDIVGKLNTSGWLQSKWVESGDTVWKLRQALSGLEIYQVPVDKSDADTPEVDRREPIISPSEAFASMIPEAKQLMDFLNKTHPGFSVNSNDYDIKPVDCQDDHVDCEDCPSEDCSDDEPVPEEFWTYDAWSKKEDELDELDELAEDLIQEDSAAVESVIENLNRAHARALDQVSQIKDRMETLNTKGILVDADLLAAEKDAYARVQLIVDRKQIAADTIWEDRMRRQVAKLNRDLDGRPDQTPDPGDDEYKDMTGPDPGDDEDKDMSGFDDDFNPDTADEWPEAPVRVTKKDLITRIHELVVVETNLKDRSTDVNDLKLKYIAALGELERLKEVMIDIQLIESSLHDLQQSDPISDLGF